MAKTKLISGPTLQYFFKPLFIPLLTISAGAASVLSFAPFGWYPLPMLTLLWLFWIWRDASPTTALFQGWLFGFGLMGFGVFWLRISVSQFGGVDAALATTATIMFITVIAAFFGFAGWLSCRLTAHPTMRLALTIPAAWGLMEWLRGWVLTGFPWLALGYSQIDSPLGGYAPVLGVYGVSWLLVLSAGWLRLGVDNWQSKPGQAALWLSMALLPWGGGWLLTGHAWSTPAGLPFQVSLVQPSIPQSLKWNPELRIPSLKTYQRMSQEANGTLIVWPETAVPDFLHRAEAEWLLPLAQELAQRGARLLIGVPVLDPDGKRYYNGAVLVGTPEAVYYKRHLVPFGEFLPFKNWLGPLLDFLKIPMSNFTPGASGSPDIKFGGQTVGISICYEDAFGEEVRAALPAATYLLNLSNDAWFGDSLAPHQHLEIARMRALETGRPLIRSTNSGISALIGPMGEIQASTNLFAETVLTGPIQPMQGMTPFVRWGNSVAVVLMFMGLIGGFLGFKSSVG